LAKHQGAVDDVAKMAAEAEQKQKKQQLVGGCGLGL